MQSNLGFLSTNGYLYIGLLVLSTPGPCCLLLRRRKGKREGGWEEGPCYVGYSCSKGRICYRMGKYKKRPIDSRTRTRFDSKVLFAYSKKKKTTKKKIGAWKLVFNFIPPVGLSRLFLLKELKRSLDRKLSDKTSNIQ